jgi:hypothetical protein
MTPDNSLSIYFSHSWKPPHLPVNLGLWERIARHCHLLIDQPVHELREKAPPWYISRIESLMRRSDAFVACMPSAPAAPNDALDGDWAVRASPWLLFEIRLAERANLPRFVLYDWDSQFAPSGPQGPYARYVPCRMSEVATFFEGGRHDRGVIEELDEWLVRLERSARPIRRTDTGQWACLVGDDAGAGPKRDSILVAMRSAGFGKPRDLSGYANDAELSGLMGSLSLLVSDVSDPKTLPLYHYAHSQMVPTIRLHPPGEEGSDAHLPPLLRGHPAGYQLDTLPPADLESNVEEIKLRAQALRRSATPIMSLEAGRYELQQRGYKKHLIFISHDLKASERVLIGEIGELCRRHGIDFWEYEEKNRSGEHWKSNLDVALDAMTHFIPLLSGTYEHSPMCNKELDSAAARTDIEILPFLLGARQRPCDKLRRDSAHHERLPEEKSPAENARKVVENVLKHIRR